jgi:hypothetical protein
MQKTNSAPEVKAEIDKLEALKKRAARQAAKKELAPEVHPVVECTVLPMGDGKISMGEHVAGLGTAHYEEAEKFSVILPVALALYEKGYVNFDGARDALAEAKAARRAEQIADMANEEAYHKLVALAVG